MRIYLLRHAKAEPGYPDAERRLAEKGRRHAETLGRFFGGGQAGPPPGTLWRSPLLRAKETSELFLEAAGIEPDAMEIHPELEPEMDPLPLVGRMARAEGDLLVVGHNPNISILASLLLSGERGRSRVRFKTCQLACFEWLPVPSHGQIGPAELCWSLDPRLVGS